MIITSNMLQTINTAIQEFNPTHKTSDTLITHCAKKIFSDDSTTRSWLSIGQKIRRNIYHFFHGKTKCTAYDTHLKTELFLKILNSHTQAREKIFTKLKEEQPSTHETKTTPTLLTTEFTNTATWLTKKNIEKLAKQMTVQFENFAEQKNTENPNTQPQKPIHETGPEQVSEIQTALLQKK